ncbi:hypothetical protein ABPG74_010334 [Tetrahymena malaccensis]
MNNNTRYFKEEKSKCRKKVPRVYTYQNKEISSIQQQIVVDLSQSSYSQPQNFFDDDSIYTFCQSQNKNQAKQYSTQSVSISVENSLDNNLQLKGYQNSFQSSVSIKVSSSNNQPKPNKNRGKSENKKNNNLKRSTSLKSIVDQLSEQQDKSASISSISFSNSIQFEPNRNKFYTSADSVNLSNKRLTRSASQNQNQIIFNNIFSGMQHIKDKGTQQNNSSNTSSRMAKIPITKGTGKQNQKNILNCGDSDICQIEKTKYKKKDYNNSQSSVEASKINFLVGAASTTQPKQRKNENNFSQEKEYNDDDEDELYYLRQTAKAYDNRLADENRLIFADEKDYKNLYLSHNQKMFDENQQQSLKIVKKSNNIFNNNEKPYPKNEIIKNSFINQGNRKADSAQTSVTQCKEQVERNQSSKLFEKNLNGAKKGLDKVPFFFFDEDEDLRLSNKLSSLKSQDETHLNIDDQNIWNKNSCQNLNSSEKNQQKQNSKLDFFNIKQINHQNIWNQDNSNEAESIDLNQMFSKKIKNSQKNQQCFGVDNAFTIDYEKLRYTSSNNDRIRHYEFNCFKDKDLRIEQKFQKKIQELTLDDDNQTDDETLDYYVGVCFNDLVIGIEMNKEESQEFDGESQSNYSCSNSENSSKKLGPLWKYFKPPNHSEAVEA